MRTWASVPLLLLLSAGLANAQSSTAWADKLFAGDLVHDFGVVPRATKLKYTFKFTNIYKVPLEVTSVRVSCGCVEATFQGKVVQPNQSADLLVTMDSGKFVGAKSVRIYVTVGPEYVSTATLTVSANASQDVVITPTDIDFGQVARGQTPEKSVDVVYAGAKADWRVDEIAKSASSPFELKAENITRGYRITATLKPDAPSGQFKQEVILKTNDPGSPTFTFHVVGSVQATLSATPSNVNVAGLRVGESQTKKVLIRGSKPFRIVSIDGQGDGVTADIPNRQEATMILNVNIQPTQVGELRKQLTVRTDLENEAITVLIEGEVAP